MNINDWLASSGLDRLDAELILAHTLKKPREWILAHGEFEIPDQTRGSADKMARWRRDHEPLAYILGYKEFYGRKFVVTPDVLIPRPETEQIVEIAKKLLDEDFLPSHVKTYIPDDADRFVREDGSAGRPVYDVFTSDGSEERTVSSRSTLLDVGTGSGAIAITLALECPTAQIAATDISDAALRIARRNARDLGAKVKIIRSNLLENVTGKFDIITANLPYVAQEWQVSPDVAYEPKIALFAKDGGLELIKKLIQQAPDHLEPNGFLVLELDPRQTKSIQQYASKHSFLTITKKPYLLVLQRRRIPEATEHE